MASPPAGNAAADDQTAPASLSPDEEAVRRPTCPESPPSSVADGRRPAQVLVAESLAVKTEANALFAARDYHNALSRYDDALAACPRHLDYERAVLQSNMAACHIKLEQWPEAATAATAALDGLAKLDKPDPEADGSPPHARAPAAAARRDDDADEGVVSAGARQSARAPAQPECRLAAQRADVVRIRTKALLRRARARAEAGGWQNLAGAEDDYRALAAMPGLGPADARTVAAQLRALPPRTKAAQEAEMADMWGKLRSLGDGILKPFGLSTSNFHMVKDEATGGYSVNFSRGDDGGSSSPAPS